jgi:acid phosphatase family membrane protein YuiD
MNDAVQIALGTLQGLGASTVFILALFIGFCVVFGFTKTMKTAGGSARVIKSLDERISHQPMAYLAPTAPRGLSGVTMSTSFADGAAHLRIDLPAAHLREVGGAIRSSGLPPR